MKYYSKEKSFFSLEDLNLWLKDHVKTVFSLKIISTVPEKNQQQINEVKILLEKHQHKIADTEVFKIDASNLKNLYPSIGPDRAIKLEAALKMQLNRDIILMDFGTATTLSAANSKFEFVIGFISLGFKASLKALSEKGSQLPDLSEAKTRDDLTDQTQIAIYDGSYLAHEALVDAWISEAKSRLEKPVLICTGGSADLFKDKFDYYIDDRELLINYFNQDHR